MAIGVDEVDLWILLSLFSCAAPAAGVILFCKFGEKRSLNSMGINFTNFPKNYFIGMAMGFAAFTVSLMICVALGAAKYSHTDFYGNVPYLIIVAFGWIIQGAEEEILCRGWLMPNLAQRLPLWAAVLGNSIVFSLAHLANDGFGLMPFINIWLIGIAFSLISLRFDSIIPACAFHSVWNAVQGNFYGLSVSGISPDTSVFVFRLTPGNDIINGGAFGIEGGIGVTVVSVVIILICLFVKGKSESETAEK